MKQVFRVLILFWCFVSSNLAFCGICRVVEPKVLEEQAVRHSTERSRQAGFGAGGAQATGLACPRTGQDLAAVVTVPAQPGSREVAGPQHRYADAFTKSSQTIEKLRRRAQASEIELAYVDEAGFAQAHPNRSAWTPRGEQYLIDAPRGQRLNVIAALLSSGTVEYAHYWQTITAETFLGFVADLAQQIRKPLVIVLDNASIHDAVAIRPAHALLEKEGFKFEFLSPYSPELNRMETMWRLMKLRWLAVKRRTKEELERGNDHVFAHFGSQFRMEF